LSGGGKIKKGKTIGLNRKLFRNGPGQRVITTSSPQFLAVKPYLVGNLHRVRGGDRREPKTREKGGFPGALVFMLGKGGGGGGRRDSYSGIRESEIQKEPDEKWEKFGPSALLRIPNMETHGIKRERGGEGGNEDAARRITPTGKKNRGPRNLASWILR